MPSYPLFCLDGPEWRLSIGPPQCAPHEGWRGPDGDVLRTFAIITTRANALIAALHDRMPVILEEGDWPAWLGEGEGEPVALLRPAADEVLKLWPVSRAVNTPRNNSADLLKPIEALDEEAGPAPA